jgi:hypothetical protein
MSFLYNIRGVIYDFMVYILAIKEELVLEAQELLFSALQLYFFFLNLHHICLLLLINKHNIILHVLD